jgi:hypothetical protein
MFEAIIAVCIANSLNGEPDSQCVAFKAEQVFRTYEACRSWADREEINRALNASKRLQKMVVIQIACGDMKA